jgi:hypothetical protein
MILADECLVREDESGATYSHIAKSYRRSTERTGGTRRIIYALIMGHYRCETSGDSS